ncbi:MAG: hypothetical protein AAF149_03695 [Bacteroidota bacterium]
MKNTFLTSFVMAFMVLVGCVSQDEHSRVKNELDSIQFKLDAAQKAVATLHEVGILMDSVDAARSQLSMDMEMGTNYQDYKTRMKNIQDYIHQTESKLDQLQVDLEKSDANRAAYARTVKKLRKDLAERGKELSELQTQVENYKSENDELITSLDLKNSELEDKTAEIELKKEELTLIEARIQELMASAKVSEAEAYFARAIAVEEAANRTKLAPKRKKETYKEAITLYQEAVALGHASAQEKIDALTKKI